MAHQNLQPNTQYQFARPADNQCAVHVAGGSLAITPSQADDIEVYCKIDQQHVDSFDFSVDSNGRFTLEAKKKPLSSGFPKVLVMMQVPADCALKINVGGGSIDVGRHNAAISAEVGGGNLHIAGAVQPLNVVASGGSITVDQIKGASTVKASGGSIRMAAVQGHADVQVSGGSMDVELLDSPDAVLRSSGGSVRLKVGSTAAFSLNASASGGTVTILPPLIQGGVVGSHYSGAINGGGPTSVTVNSSGGSIVILGA